MELLLSAQIAGMICVEHGDESPANQKRRIRQLAEDISADWAGAGEATDVYVNGEAEHVAWRRKRNSERSPAWF